MPEKLRTTPRSGSMRASCFNSGLEVWLYDEASIGEIEKSKAFDGIYGDDDFEEFEKRIKPLLKKGLIVAYGMEGDGAVDIDLIIGEPLTKKELATARWLKPQKAFLSLPSGKLRLESNDCIHFSEDATDPGAVLHVPAGDYLLTLYRIDNDAMSQAGLADDYAGAQEVIVLTPGEKAKPQSKQPAILPFEKPLNPAKAFVFTSEKTVEGQANFQDWWDTIFFGIDADGIRKLGLSDGSLIQISVPACGVETTIIYLEQNGTPGEFFMRTSKLSPPNRNTDEWGYGYLMMNCSITGGEVLMVFRRDAKVCTPDKLKKKWTPATLKVLD